MSPTKHAGPVLKLTPHFFLAPLLLLFPLQEWLAARNAIVALEASYEDADLSLRFPTQSEESLLPEYTSKVSFVGVADPPQTSLKDAYEALAEIQEHFNWLVGVLVDALFHDAATCRRFIALLCSNWQKHLESDTLANMASTTTPSLYHSLSSLQRTAESDGKSGKSPLIMPKLFRQKSLAVSRATVVEIFTLNAKIQQEGESEEAVRAFNRNSVFEWASVGIECLGVNLRLIRQTSRWKVALREVHAAKSVLFERNYPCPPLLSLFEHFGFGFVASAVLCSGFPTPCVPIHLPGDAPAKVGELLAGINAALTELQLEEIQRLFSTPLPNPGKLLSAYCPRYVPPSTVASLTADGSKSPPFSIYDLVTSAIMCLGRQSDFPSSDSSKEQLECFGKSVVSAARMCLDTGMAFEESNALQTSLWLKGLSIGQQQQQQEQHDPVR